MAQITSTSNKQAILDTNIHHNVHIPLGHENPDQEVRRLIQAHRAHENSRHKPTPGGSNWQPIGNYEHSFKNIKNLLPEAPNKKFIFHNKLPKCGSTTMNDILKNLAAFNHFLYFKMDAETMKFDEEINLIKWIFNHKKSTKMSKNSPLFLMQHHYWMNFSKYDIEQPTMINVIREPMDWFSSHYHFQMNGWYRSPGDRAKKKEKSRKNEMPLEDCIMKEKFMCKKNKWRYIEFFVGSDAYSSLKWQEHTGTSTTSVKDTKNLDTDEEKRLGVAHAKNRLLKDYHVIGVLEQFEDTLELFEHMMPEFYHGASKIYKSYTIQETKNQTRSIGKVPVSIAAEIKMKTSVLRHESDLYDFTRALFNERLRYKRSHFLRRIFGL